MYPHHRSCVWTFSALLLLGTIAMPADASWLHRNKKASEPEVYHPRPHRFKASTPLCFLAGHISRASASQWLLDDTALTITRDTNIVRLDGSSEPVSLSDGAEIYVMGKRSGSMLVCKTILVVPYVSLTKSSWQNNETIQWSASDPTVGVGTGPQ